MTISVFIPEVRANESFTIEAAHILTDKFILVIERQLTDEILAETCSYETRGYDVLHDFEDDEALPVDIYLKNVSEEWVLQHRDSIEIRINGSKMPARLTVFNGDIQDTVDELLSTAAVSEADQSNAISVENNSDHIVSEEINHNVADETPIPPMTDSLSAHLPTETEASDEESTEETEAVDEEASPSKEATCKKEAAIEKQSQVSSRAEPGSLFSLNVAPRQMLFFGAAAVVAGAVLVSKCMSWSADEKMGPKI